jgi:hypothetical protein
MYEEWYASNLSSEPTDAPGSGSRTTWLKQLGYLAIYRHSGIQHIMAIGIRHPEIQPLAVAAAPCRYDTATVSLLAHK